MINVLKTGQALENPVFWKKAQNILNFISGSVPFILLFFPSAKQYLTPDNIAAVSGFLGAANVYFTVATTEKIGV
mgnify:CR=1 FL=1